MTGRRLRTSSAVLGLVLGLGLALGPGGTATAAPADDVPATGSCPAGSVVGPPDALSSEPYSCTLVPETPVDLEFADGGSYHGFRMDVPAGAHFTVTATPSSRDTYVEVGVNDPRADGQWWHYDGRLSTGPGTTAQSMFFEVPPVAVARAVIIGFRTYNTSEQSIQVTPHLVNDPPAIALTPGVPVTVSTSVPGQDVSLTYRGTAGQKITVATSRSTFPPDRYLTWPAFRLRLFGPDGREVRGADDDEIPALAHGTATLGSDGTYTILVDPFAAGTGSVVVELSVTPA